VSQDTFGSTRVLRWLRPADTGFAGPGGDIKPPRYLDARKKVSFAYFYR